MTVLTRDERRKLEVTILKSGVADFLQDYVTTMFSRSDGKREFYEVLIAEWLKGKKLDDDQRDDFNKLVADALDAQGGTRKCQRDSTSQKYGLKNQWICLALLELLA